MGKKAEMKRKQLAHEFQQMTDVNPLAAAERCRILLGVEFEKAMKKIGESFGHEQIDRALSNALKAWNHYHDGISKQMAEITGRGIYFNPRDTIYRYLPTEELQSRCRSIRAQFPPKNPLPEEAQMVLAALRKAFPPKQNFFEGEDSWQAHLQKHGLKEADPNAGYPQPEDQIRPSREYY